MTRKITMLSLLAFALMVVFAVGNAQAAGCDGALDLQLMSSDVVPDVELGLDGQQKSENRAIPSGQCCSKKSDCDVVPGYSHFCGGPSCGNKPAQCLYNRNFSAPGSDAASLAEFQAALEAAGLSR